MNKWNLKQEENLAEFYTSKKLRTFTPRDTICYHNFQKGNKWESGVVIKKAGQVTYLIDNCHGILQKHVDQLHFANVNIDIDPKDDSTKYYPRN